jgi:hypothetical protein
MPPAFGDEAFPPERGTPAAPERFVVATAPGADGVDVRTSSSVAADISSVEVAVELVASWAYPRSAPAPPGDFTAAGSELLDG